MVAKFNNVKNKLKKAALISGISALSVLPAKTSAQSNAAYDGQKENKTEYISMDTVRLGQNIINKSSPQKNICVNLAEFGHIFGYSNTWLNLNFQQGFIVIPPQLLERDGNTYVYSTDKMYDKYRKIMEKYYPGATKEILESGGRIDVQHSDIYTMIRLELDENGIKDYRLKHNGDFYLGTGCFVLINTQTEQVLYVNDGAFLEGDFRIFPKEERFYVHLTSYKSGQDIELHPDGSGFVVDTVPGNKLSKVAPQSKIRQIDKSR